MASVDAPKGIRMQEILASWGPLTIVTGHYGTGKTNLSLNLARDLRAWYPHVTLVDIDVVNPYFRSSDSRVFLEQTGIDLVGSAAGMDNLESPSLSPGIARAIMSASAGEHAVILDVGGDDVGARALGRFAAQISEHDYRMLYVVNRQRMQTATVNDALQLMHEVEGASHLFATQVVGNTHLKWQTDAATIIRAIPFELEVARAAGLDLLFVTAPRPFVHDVDSAASEMTPSVKVYPIDIVVRTPWENGLTFQ